MQCLLFLESFHPRHTTSNEAESPFFLPAPLHLHSSAWPRTHSPITPDPSSSGTAGYRCSAEMPKLRVSPQQTSLVALVTATMTHHDLRHVHLGDNHLHDLRGNRRTCNDSWKKEEKMTVLETTYLFPGVVPQKVLHSQI